MDAWNGGVKTSKTVETWAKLLATLELPRAPSLQTPSTRLWSLGPGYSSR